MDGMQTTGGVTVPPAHATGDQDGEVYAEYLRRVAAGEDRTSALIAARGMAAGNPTDRPRCRVCGQRAPLADDGYCSAFCRYEAVGVPLGDEDPLELTEEDEARIRRALHPDRVNYLF